MIEMVTTFETHQTVTTDPKTMLLDHYEPENKLDMAMIEQPDDEQDQEEERDAQVTFSQQTEDTLSLAAIYNEGNLAHTFEKSHFGDPGKGRYRSNTELLNQRMFHSQVTARLTPQANGLNTNIFAQGKANAGKVKADRLKDQMTGPFHGEPKLKGQLTMVPSNMQEMEAID